MPAAATTEHLREQRQRSTAIPPITMRVPDACRYLGVGRSTLYVLIGRREIETIKLGSSTLLLTASLASLVERRRSSVASPCNEHGR